ncbi:aspartate 1-decarboxylase [Aliifodinibius salipaludis]|uniref:Aspartate 1-decarboxylase n=1 Tax=Fodinibius salipaludis TaxID=2032627 RepID=A0A2A2GDG5_9BACT|nr:aspartate 1-decarboxylase [Aliifodinibius salipaludis]PAU94909.1 aspartate 1-decarboxylase [Aliifodinibius salipaludis]
MKLTMFKSKLHQMKITEANLHYEGSITIDQELLNESGILPYEKVQVVNITNGERLETYAIPGEEGSRVCCLNGAAARKTQVGDRVIIISYAEMTPEEAKDFKPKVVIVDENNDPKTIVDESEHGTKYDLEKGVIDNSVVDE